MLQHLINTTAIWLCSLLLFGALLRREGFHQYNRLYLIGTFLFGLLLPFWQWERAVNFMQPVFNAPLERVLITKTQLEAIATPGATVFNLELVLLTIYFAGVAVMLLVLLGDVIKLARYYKNGRKSTEEKWLVIETGENHAPFSLLNTLYVRTKEQYEREEWLMLFEHEKQHYEQLHFADVLLFQLARIVFWFHPLVYIYNNMLLMVHEYQADSATVTKPQQYGRFLLEQSLLGGAPIIAHSFNRSPIKNRIAMLTKNTPRGARVKMLIFIPLVLVSVYCFAQHKNAGKFIVEGNRARLATGKFVFSKPTIDTIELEDPVTGNTVTKFVQTDPKVTKLNGADVYDAETLNEKPIFPQKYKNLHSYVFNQLKPTLKQLADGAYVLQVFNVIVDANGVVSSYTCNGIWRTADKDKVPVELQKAVFNELVTVMSNCPKLKPAAKEGKNVNANINEFTNRFAQFKIMHHKLYLQTDVEWVEL